jgi:UDP-N-acetylmuramoyl-L-alanyl-D-glutamate--2,6-diaminopimelate ligase
MAMTLAELLQPLTFVRRLNPDVATACLDRPVTGISSDSRNLQAGMIFVALMGTQTDGHHYIRQAAAAGALAIVVRTAHTSQMPLSESIPVYACDDTYMALGALSSRFHGDPGRRLHLIGVTGTNGKTTVTHLIEKMLADAEQSVGLVGTLGQRLHKAGQTTYVTTGLTTPLAGQLHEILAGMVQEQAQYVVMEVSSHALEQHRTYGCDFEVAVFTNLTQDHLDYHKTMENYCKAKCLLFSGLKPTTVFGRSPAAVINLDDPWAQHFLKACAKTTRLYTYGLNAPEATIRTENVRFSITGASFTALTPHGKADVQLQIAGKFSIYNALAALAAGLALGIPLTQCVRSLQDMRGVRGRFEVVADHPYVIVDYAHTPDGLENILAATRLVLPPDGRLIVVFGCGGDRDATKRPKMGAIAQRLADVVVVTSDNPRSEEPQQIITDILHGMQHVDAQRLLVNADRQQAIQQALDLARPTDIIVVAGKGHEDYQILKHRTIHFDDREVVQAYIARRQSDSLGR